MNNLERAGPSLVSCVSRAWGLGWPSDHRRPITGYGGENPAEFLASGHGLKNRSGQTS